MKIILPNGGGFLEIAEDHPDALKIRRGYEYRIENDVVIFIGGKTNFDLNSILPKLKSKTASIQEIQETLAYLLSKHLESGKI